MEKLASLLERLSTGRMKWLLITSALVSVTVWVVFFDSHSLLRRYQWQQRLAAVTEQNQQMQREIVDLETKLEEVDSERVIEEIAREQYGMRRPGETVYRVATSDSTRPAPAP